MRKRQYLISKGICVIVSLLLVSVSILLCGQMRIVSSGRKKTGNAAVSWQGNTEFSNIQLKKTEKLSVQEIRSVKDVHKKSEVLNNEVQPRNRLPVFLLFLLLTELILECNSKCQWIGHTEFKEKTCFYSNVSKRRGPPVSVTLF